MTESAETGIIVLAAGSSSRMGTSKQLLPLDGKPMLLRTVEAALQSGTSRIVVVLGSNEHEHRAVISALPVDVTVNLSWSKGIGGSIKAGLQYLLSQYPALKSVTIVVSDQPSVSSGHIALLRARHDENQMPIVASAYGDTIGVPVLFAKNMFGKLSALHDDEGAKKIIQKYRQQMIAVPLPGGETDLDTPGDYESFIKK